MVWQKGRKTPSLRLIIIMYTVWKTEGVLSSSLEMIISSLFSDSLSWDISVSPLRINDVPLGSDVTRQMVLYRALTEVSGKQ